MQKLLLVLLAGMTLLFSSCRQGEDVGLKANSFIDDVSAKTALNDGSAKEKSSDVAAEKVLDFEDVFSEEVAKNKDALGDLCRSGESIYSIAEKASVTDIEEILYRMHMRECYALAKKEAELQLAQAETALEERYKLRLFNLRMELEVLRLNANERKILTEKLEKLLATKRAERLLLEQKSREKTAGTADSF